MNGIIVLGWLVLLLVMLGLLALWASRRTRQRTGLPAGSVIYSDTRDWHAVEEPLVSRRYGLVGKPDYLLAVNEGGKQRVIPVEVKSRRRPAAPYASHILQLGTYCLLVEDCYHARPPHGLLRYADATIQVPFTDELRRAVLDAAAAIRHARTQPSVHRQHTDPARCRACGYRPACGAEALD